MLLHNPPHETKAFTAEHTEHTEHTERRIE